MYVRFQSPEPGKRGLHNGVFGLMNGLGRGGLLTPEEHAEWRAGNAWFDAAYPDPTTVDATVYDREVNPLATAWFKDSAAPLLERVERYLEILAAHDVACVRVESDNPAQPCPLG